MFLRLGKPKINNASIKTPITPQQKLNETVMLADKLEIFFLKETDIINYWILFIGTIQ